MKSRNRSIRWQVILVVLSAVIVVAPACKKKDPAKRGSRSAEEGGSQTQANKDDNNDGIVARVGDLVVSRAEFDAEVKRISPEGQLNKVQKRNAERQALTGLIHRRLIELGAAKEKIEVTEEQVDAHLAGQVKGMGGEKPFLEYLAENNFTEETYRETLHHSMLRALLRDRYFPEEITDEQMRVYYKSYATNPGRGSKVKVSRILLTLEPTDSPEKWEEATARLSSIKAEIEAGLPFEEAAVKYSQGPYAKRGGNMGWATDKRRPVEVFAPALKLSKGEFSGPTRVKQGVQLIYVTDTKNDAAGDFERERSNIRKILESRRDQRNDRRLTEKLRAQYRVETLL